MKIKIKDIPENTKKRICSKYPVLFCIGNEIDCPFSGKDLHMTLDLVTNM